MLFLGKAPEAALELLERLELLTDRLLQGLDVSSQATSYSQEPNLLDCFDKEQLGVLRGGEVTVLNDEVEVVCLQPGDLIGLSRVFGLPQAQLRVEEGAEIQLIHRDDFMAFIGEDAHRQHRFSNYLLTMIALYETLLADYHRHSNQQAPAGFQNILKGEVIVREGDYADTVYQLMSGSADVTVNDMRVGEILSGEIFGAMAVFTGEKRNATVVAREDCQLLAIPKGQFVDLIKAQPEIAITLLDNMSRRIKSLNEQVTAGTKETA